MRDRRRECLNLHRRSVQRQGRGLHDAPSDSGGRPLQDVPVGSRGVTRRQQPRYVGHLVCGGEGGLGTCVRKTFEILAVWKAKVRSKTRGLGTVNRLDRINLLVCVLYVGGEGGIRSQ